MIKNHDPRIHDKDFKPFEDDDEEPVNEPKKKKELFTAKDMIREQALAGTLDDDSDSMEAEEKPLTPMEEDRQLKKEVLEGIQKEEYP